MDSVKKIPFKNKQLVSRIIDGKAVILSLQRSKKKKDRISILNETATRIWGLVDGKKSILDIQNRISREYDVSKDVARSKVNNFFLKMKKNGLLIIRSRPN